MVWIHRSVTKRWPKKFSTTTNASTKWDVKHVGGLSTNLSSVFYIFADRKWRGSCRAYSKCNSAWGDPWEMWLPSMITTIQCMLYAKVGYIVAWKSYLTGNALLCLMYIILQMHMRALNIKYVPMHILSNVCLRYSPFTQLSLVWHMGSFTVIHLGNCENMCNLSYHHQ